MKVFILILRSSNFTINITIKKTIDRKSDLEKYIGSDLIFLETKPNQKEEPRNIGRFSMKLVQS